MHSLLQKYPRSTAARNATLPLRVKTIPSGAQLSDGHRVLGTSPILIRVRPLTKLRLEATLPGFKPTTIVIDEPTSPDVIIRLPML